MGSVHQGPRNCKNNELDVAKADLVRALDRVVKAELASGASFAQQEVAALSAGNEAARNYCEQQLQRMSDSYGEDLLINEVHYRRSHEPGQGFYHSLCGALHPFRATYRQVGERNGPTVVPLELEAGLVEGTTPALAYSIALDYANRTSREYVESMSAAHRQVPSRAMVERVGKAVGTRAGEAAPSIERYLRFGEKVPEEAVSISTGLDRTSVPYEVERAEGEEPSTRRKKRTKPYDRTPPPPVDVDYKMDYVGTVSLIDKDREKLVTRKYFASHESGPEGILKRMMADIRAMRRQRPDLSVGIVQDGAPEMWNLMRSSLKSELGIVAPKEGIDRYHLGERLGKVAKVLTKNETSRKLLLNEWEDKLDQDDGAIDEIEKYIKNRTYLYGWDARSTLLDNLTYIENNKDRMRYVTLREAGLPVGSGATEGACKSLVAVRAKRSGQRWHDEGVSAAIELRAIHQSERLPGFWRHLHRHYVAQVETILEEAA